MPSAEKLFQDKYNSRKFKLDNKINLMSSHDLFWIKFFERSKTSNDLFNDSKFESTFKDSPSNSVFIRRNISKFVESVTDFYSGWFILFNIKFKQTSFR